MKIDVFDRARLYAVSLLNYRPRTEAEIRQKLKKKGFPAHVINSLVADFKEKSLIDDKKFSMLWTRSRLQGQGHSFRKIKRELLLKGVDRQLIDNTAVGLKQEFSEMEIALKLSANRMASFKGIDAGKAKRRLYSYLMRRGFSNSIVFEVINEAYPDTR
ncbi:MAG: regulatory protein RecX [Candidatus Omnitrophica bacterium]|nr:regulatory protein RecX [Candidatus Omnitrophota bacterium]